MNIKLFKSKMVLNGDTNASRAVALNITPQRSSAKINGTHGAEFTQSEIMKIIERYELTADEVAECFFNQKVS